MRRRPGREADGTGRALRRRSFFWAAPALLTACAGVALHAFGAGPQTAAPRAALPPARPIPLPAMPGSALEPLGGLIIDPDVLGFGGLSGLHLTDDLQLTAISDIARWMQARLVLEDMRPVGLAELRTGRLKDGSGHALPRGFTGDAESLARQPDGSWLVGFERWHRIRAFRDLNGPGTYVEVPPELAEAPGNGGLESLAVLRDGRWLLIAEAYPAPDSEDATRAWLGRPGTDWLRLAYRPAPDMYPADACPLPDGGALVLERSFSVFRGFRGRLVRLRAAQLAAATGDTLLEGEELLRLAPPLPTDNYEGVATAHIGGRTVVAMISDDNQNMLQQTLLLLFVLPAA